MWWERSVLRTQVWGQGRIGDDLGQVFVIEAMREEGEIIGAGLQVLVLQKVLVLA